MKIGKPPESANLPYLLRRGFLYSTILLLVVIGARALYYVYSHYMFKWTDPDYAGEVAADPSIASIDMGDWVPYILFGDQHTMLVVILSTIFVAFMIAVVEYCLLRSIK